MAMETESPLMIHDISVPIAESLAVWPGDPPVTITRVLQLEQGDAAAVSTIALSSHTGTHVDAPAHYCADGAAVDDLDLHRLVGPALVVTVLTADRITATVLDQLLVPAATRRLLLRTSFSGRGQDRYTRFERDFPALTPDGAMWLRDHDIQLVGIDTFSVAPFDEPQPVHRILLDAGMVVVEGLDLAAIGPGLYQFVCLPLKIAGLDGAPARAILIESQASCSAA